MAEKEHKEQKIGSQLSAESIKVIAESVGISGIPDDAAGVLAEDSSYRLKQIIQEAVKFMHHGKRLKLSTADIDHALRAENIEPLYGFEAGDSIPFRFASGGGRELHFIEEKEFDLQDVVNSTLPKIPVDISLKAHWLCIDGIQPSTAENPPPASKDQQQKEILDTTIKKVIDKQQKVPPVAEPSKIKHKHKGITDLAKVKDLSTHELSVEQQLYYKEITEACVGPDEARRSEALQSLASDPGLHQMLPRFSTFISEGVKINVVQNNLALLIYLMRMVKSIMDNQTLYLEKYLHEFIPAVCTCIVSKQLCMRPEVDNHWALRDFAARLMGQICKNFSTSTNNIQARITKTFTQAIQSEKAALATQYGAIAGLGEMGSEVIKSFLLPHVKDIGEKVQSVLEGPILNAADKIAGENIKKSLAKYLSPVLKALKGAGASVEDYVAEFGSVGSLLHTAVGRERKSSGNQGNQLAKAAAGTSTQDRSRPMVTIPTPRSQFVIQQSSSLGSLPGTPKTPQGGIRTPGTSSVIQGGQPKTPSTPGQQKFIVMTSQARPSNNGQSDKPLSISSGTPTVVKVMSGSAQGQMPTAVPRTPTTPKIVVMSMSQGNSSVAGQTGGNSQDLGMRSVFSEQLNSMKKESENG
ncbi:transcription initiation factor TFIID subunit 6-like [Saccostrea echinata]|uniref:transcription initiation factor TFIID subunit 6-like n=1 Tax=Saccostrea echinata TaxID=191078 RepID=UPI002A8026BA|nr:transcription initiation factor TFIID subunit 6-like [Saccostrea echinata]